MEKLRIAIIGANGYVATHLIPTLLTKNHHVNALVRRKPEATFAGVNYFIGDCEHGAGLDDALQNIDVAYYLIHSLNSGKSFRDTELRCAQNFCCAAKRAMVKRVVYLSGLGSEHDDLSEHLASRHAVGNVLRDGLDDVIELRASAVFGAGSASYEMISFLVERLPIMVLPKWVYNKTQPICVSDAIYYLSSAADLAKKLPAIIEIGGSDVVSYRDLMVAYAGKRGLKRLMIPVPFLSLSLSSLWLHLITPLQARVGKNIIESLKNNTIVNHPDFLSLFSHRPATIGEMIDQALSDESAEILSPQKDHIWRFDKAKRIFGFRFGRYIAMRDYIKINASPEEIFATIGELGGSNGWYYLNFLWRWRARLDRLVGGPGFSHGKSASPLKSGDFIDCWSVSEIKPPERLLLKSLMKMPGDAHLEFEIINEPSSILLYQTAFFRPQGVIGSIYWSMLYPIHLLLFEGLLQAIKKRSEARVHDRELSL